MTARPYRRKPPSWSIGQQVGEYEVVEYLGYQGIDEGDSPNRRNAHGYMVKDRRCRHMRQVWLRGPMQHERWTGARRRCGCVNQYVHGGGYPLLEWYVPWRKGPVCVPVHRIVMESLLGRQLDPDETVHHINGNKLNYQPENLQLRQGNHGRGVVHQCLNCGSHNIKAVQLAEAA